MVWWVQDPDRKGFVRELEERIAGADCQFRQLEELCCKGKQRNGIVTGRVFWF